MEKFIKSCKEFMADEEGLTMVEYVLGGALIVAAVTGSGLWENVGGQLDNIAGAVATPSADDISSTLDTSGL